MVEVMAVSIPVPDPSQRWQTNVQIPSEDEQSDNGLDGCPFYARCTYRMERCHDTRPPQYEVEVAGHLCACHLCDPSEKGGTLQGLS